MTPGEGGDPPTGLPSDLVTVRSHASAGPPADGLSLEDWLLGAARDLPELADVVDGLCWRLNGEGVPISRCTLHLGTLHPQLRAYAVRWWREWRKVQDIFVLHGMENTPAYRDSPVPVVIEQGRTIRCRLTATSPEEFPVLREVRAAGGTDYVAMPLAFSRGRRHCLTFTTDDPGGFADAQLDRLHALEPLVALVFELHAIAHVARDLLAVYLGRQAGTRVLHGAVRRGAVERIHSVILVADMRGFTALSNRLPGEAVIELLDDFFAALVAPIHAGGGEVLKFVGDGLIAVFAFEDAGDASRTAGRALAAAQEALAAVDRLGERRRAAGADRVDAGVALHVGDVLFGNVGAPDRLDFTAIGPAVNLASRIEALNRRLGCRLVASRDFVDLCPAGLSSLGAHRIAGLDEPCEVFGLSN